MIVEVLFDHGLLNSNSKQTTSYVHFKTDKIKLGSTGESFSEALILASTNPKYDKRLFIDLPVHYMKTTSSEHGENMLSAKMVLNV